jgi:DNA-binding PadR family transcriptional regulator
MNDLIMLAALLDGPQHGWALKKLAGFLSGSGDMHNNLVYPLLKRFVKQGWARRRSERGQRGQTRGVYSLTLRGKRELLRRLEEFAEKEAGSPAEFRVRVGLFGLLDRDSRARILKQRDQWLTSREKHFVSIRDGLTALDATDWGREVVTFLLQEVRGERRWIRTLGKRARSSGLSKKLTRS